MRQRRTDKHGSASCSRGQEESYEFAGVDKKRWHKSQRYTSQPRTWTALKLSTTWPPAVGVPKLSMGRKREKTSIWSS